MSFEHRVEIRERFDRLATAIASNEEPTKEDLGTLMQLGVRTLCDLNRIADALEALASEKLTTAPVLGPPGTADR